MGSARIQSVQLLSRFFATPRTAARQAFLSITNPRSLLKLTSIELVMPSSHLILCRPLLLPPSIFPSIRVFSNESVLRIRWPKYWSFSFSISPSSEYSVLISFRMDWFDLLAVQGTLDPWIRCFYVLLPSFSTWSLPLHLGINSPHGMGLDGQQALSGLGFLPSCLWVPPRGHSGNLWRGFCEIAAFSSFSRVWVMSCPPRMGFYGAFRALCIFFDTSTW